PFMARPLPPTRRRPWACGIGVGLLVAALAPLGYGLPELCAAGGAATIVGSFAIDVAWLVRHRGGGPW
ncbi:MAG: CDP-alcohol phosphatidyltransferase family protein, partial [Bacteroidota bacterium]